MRCLSLNELNENSMTILEVVEPIVRRLKSLDSAQFRQFSCFCLNNKLKKIRLACKVGPLIEAFSLQTSFSHFKTASSRSEYFPPFNLACLPVAPSSISFFSLPVFFRIVQIVDSPYLLSKCLTKSQVFEITLWYLNNWLFFRPTDGLLLALMVIWSRHCYKIYIKNAQYQRKIM